MAEEALIRWLESVDGRLGELGTKVDDISERLHRTEAAHEAIERQAGHRITRRRWMVETALATPFAIVGLVELVQAVK